MEFWINKNSWESNPNFRPFIYSTNTRKSYVIYDYKYINIYIWLCWLWLCWFVVRKLGVDQYWLDLIGGSRWQFDLAKRYPSTNNEMFLCHNGPSLKIGHLHQGTSSVVYGLFEIGYPQSWWLINSFPSFPPKKCHWHSGPTASASWIASWSAKQSGAAMWTLLGAAFFARRVFRRSLELKPIQSISSPDLAVEHEDWLDVYLPLWKMMEFVKLKNIIPTIGENSKPFQTTNQKMKLHSWETLVAPTGSPLGIWIPLDSPSSNRSHWIAEAVTCHSGWLRCRPNDPGLGLHSSPWGNS